jgi:hypothetical protein
MKALYLLDTDWAIDRIARICLSCLTVGAAMIVGFQQLLAEFCRHVGAHAVLQFVGRRDSMTAPVEQGGGMRPTQHKAISFHAQLH